MQGMQDRTGINEKDLWYLTPMVLMFITTLSNSLGYISFMLYLQIILLTYFFVMTVLSAWILSYPKMYDKYVQFVIQYIEKNFVDSEVTFGAPEGAFRGTQETLGNQETLRIMDKTITRFIFTITITSVLIMFNGYIVLGIMYLLVVGFLSYRTYMDPNVYVETLDDPGAF